MNERRNSNIMINKEAKSNFGSKGWIMCILCFLYYLLLMSFDNGLSFIVPAFEASQGWNQTTLFLFTTIGGWLSVILIILFSMLKRLQGTKKVIIISMGIYLICLACWTFAQNIAMYAIGAIGVKSAGTVFVYLGVEGIASNWFPTKKGIFMGWATMGISGAAVVSTFLLPALLEKGTTVALGFFLVIGVITFILTILFMRNTPEEAGAYPDNNRNISSEQIAFMKAEHEKIAHNSPWTITRSIKSWRVWNVGLIFGLFNFVAMAFMSQMIIMGLSFGHALAAIQLILLFGTIVNILSNYFGGVVDQKLGTRKATIICMLILTAAVFLIGTIGTTSLVAFGAGLILVTMGAGAGNNMMISMTTSLWGRHDIDSPYVVILLAQMVISSFGYAVMSAVAEAKGYAVACLVFAAVAVLAGILSIILKDTFLGRTTEEVMAENNKN